MGGRGAASRPGRKLVVASYNVWELYDGRGGDRYFSRLHGAPLTPAAVKQRVKQLAALYENWADRCGVLPWPPRQEEVVLRMRGQHIHLSFHRGRQFYP